MKFLVFGWDWWKFTNKQMLNKKESGKNWLIINLDSAILKTIWKISHSAIDSN